MRVTRVSFRTDLLERPNSKLVAFGSVTLDDALKIEAVKVIRHEDGRFSVQMPQRRDAMGGLHDSVHPVTDELRRHIHTEVLNALAGQRALGAGAKGSTCGRT